MTPPQKDIVPILRGVPLFAAVDDTVLAMLAARCRRRKYRAREALFHEGDPGYALYIVLAGRINIERSTDAGEVVHLAQRGSGENVGEMALVDDSPRSADAYTDGVCELLILDRADFLYCLERSPKLALSVIGCLARRIREAANKQAERQSLDVMGRLAAFLLAEMESASVEDSRGRRLISRLTQQEIAERIDTSRETVNRGLSRLRESGAIIQDGRQIVVANPARLTRLAQG
jgi:CRP/FNR family transcriptional regulator, cyclic AMP receptor protein